MEEFIQFRYFQTRKLRYKFTIIELITVVAILGIVVSMILPAVMKARHLATQSFCMNNLRSFGLAVSLYVDDYNGYLPIHNDNGMAENWERSVFVAREYYGNEFGILRCPDDEFYTAPPENPSDPFPANVNEHYWSYCFNMRVANQWPAINVLSTVKLASLLDPMRSIIYLEGDEFDGGVENFGGDGPLNNPTMEPYIRHNLAAHYLFADSRVGLMKPSSLEMDNFMSD